MKSPQPHSSRPHSGVSSLATSFFWLFGGLLGLGLLKFGNPVVMEKFVIQPQNGYELVFNPWPVKWGYGFLALVMICGVPLMRAPGRAPRWLMWLPGAWLLWQALAATRSIDPGLSWSTVVHFSSCVVCFFLGLLVLGRREVLRGFWLPIGAAFGVVLLVGFQQHFGGLEASRKYFFLYVYPHLEEVTPEYLRKLESDRIFSTLFYPNTLAGAILLFVPIVGRVVWEGGARFFTLAARRFLVGGVVAAAFACLYWSGSKAGWLVMLVVGLVGLLHLSFPRRAKMAVAALALVVGLAGFFIKYAGFFQQGAKSVGARFDYWEAGVKIVGRAPLFGTGPGTFGRAYEQIKRPESEMARLAHNDYLQQATDSGLAGFALYGAFIAGAMGYLYLAGGVRGSPLRFAVWLGLLGWSLQSLTDFGLYIPALSWPAFTFIGWLLGSAGNAIDNGARST